MNNRLASLSLVLCALSGTMSAQWQLTSAPKGVNVYAFASDGSVVLAACDTPGVVNTGGAVFRSTNNGADWVDATGGLIIPEVRALAILGSVYFIGTLDMPGYDMFGVYRSTDFGASWMHSSQGLTNKHVVSLATIGSTLLAGTYGDGVFRSLDSGSTWTPSSLDTSIVFDLVVHGSTVFAASYFWPVGYLLVSTNEGASWTQSSSAPPVYALSSDGSTIVGARDDSVFISTDNGSSWDGVDPGFPNLPIVDLIVRDANIFALTNWGNVFHSTDRGASWKFINEGLIDSMVSVLGISDSYLFAGGDPNSGVWRRSLSEVMTDVSTPDPSAPLGFALSQNYPNPFNPSTQISYSLPITHHASLKVFDLLGREVAVLVDEEKPAGMHSAKWDASGFNSGVYFYRLAAGSFSETRRLLLVR